MGGLNNIASGRWGAFLKGVSTVAIPACAVVLAPAATPAALVIASVGLLSGCVSAGVDIFGNDSRSNRLFRVELENNLRSINEKLEEISTVLNLVRDILFSLAFFTIFKFVYPLLKSALGIFAFIGFALVILGCVYTLIAHLENRTPRIPRN